MIFFHASLFEEMLAHAGYADTKYIQEVLDGLNVVGPVRPSHIWPPEPDVTKHSPELNETDLLGPWAWEYRARVREMACDEKSQTIYDDTVEEAALGFCEGAWDAARGQHRGFTEDEVSAHLGTDVWLPLKRFGVLQKN